MASKLSLMRLAHDDLKEAIRTLGKTTTYTLDADVDYRLLLEIDDRLQKRIKYEEQKQ